MLLIVIFRTNYYNLILNCPLRPIRPRFKSIKQCCVFKFLLKNVYITKTQQNDVLKL